MSTSSSPVYTSGSSLKHPAMNCYQADQRVKYLYLQAEIEVLLHQLQNYKPQGKDE
ncbi:MAG: hypothetical protein DSM107014_09995 [Gomphosphaeria aponina SAG 52.96 = DSM 107014]|uniref:Uncharacterized protein n=1 Tax=Gomphosphaeria aponina SAG 52.96 = DSM 107014 TaxID=1521640 RepID=A0A941GS71_9CHRO|nr:hypothetical protein [Gomphosphaeria aponina SAG 52.96 = DSM 107014]